jgi:hypothetical protein
VKNCVSLGSKGEIKGKQKDIGCILSDTGETNMADLCEAGCSKVKLWEMKKLWGSAEGLSYGAEF